MNLLAASYILGLIALGAFLLAAFHVAAPVELVALGLVFFVASALVHPHPHP